MALLYSPVAVQGGVVKRRVAARVPAVDSAIRSPKAEKKERQRTKFRRGNGEKERSLDVVSSPGQKFRDRRGLKKSLKAFRLPGIHR